MTTEAFDQTGPVRSPGPARSDIDARLLRPPSGKEQLGSSVCELGGERDGLRPER